MNKASYKTIDPQVTLKILGPRIGPLAQHLTRAQTKSNRYLQLLHRPPKDPVVKNGPSPSDDFNFDAS